jgi:hypothetical protein
MVEKGPPDWFSGQGPAAVWGQVRGTVVDAARSAFESVIDEALAAGRDAVPERQVYADWLEEQNTEPDARLAAAQRWLAASGKTARRSANVTQLPGHAGPVWEWWAPPCVEPDDRAAIPEAVLRAKPCSPHTVAHVRFREYPDRRAAEQALAEGLAAVPAPLTVMVAAPQAPQEVAAAAAGGPPTGWTHPPQCQLGYTDVAVLQTDHNSWSAPAAGLAPATAVTYETVSPLPPPGRPGPTPSRPHGPP